MPQPRRRRLETEMIGDVTVVQFVDKKILDAENIQIIGEQLFSLVEQDGLTRLLLNLNTVEYLSVGFIGTLVALNTKTKDANGRLVLCEVHPAIWEGVFKIWRLQTFFKHAETQNAGLLCF